MSKKKKKSSRKKSTVEKLILATAIVQLISELIDLIKSIIG